jgi:hypothetical protein
VSDGRLDKVVDIRQAELNHFLHWIALIFVAAYAWQLHGWGWALATFIGLITVISIGNLVILAVSGNLAFVRINRWGWIVVSLLLVAFSGASIQHV